MSSSPDVLHARALTDLEDLSAAPDLAVSDNREFVELPLAGARLSDAPSVAAVVERSEFIQGQWTRLAGGTAIGDTVVEGVMSSLANEVETRSRAQGYAAGWAQGRQEAAAEAAQAEADRARRAAEAEAARVAEHREAMMTLAQAAQALRDAIEQVADAVAVHATEVACDLTEALLGHELSVAAHPGLDALPTALALAPRGAAVTVRLNPAEAAIASEIMPALAATVIADPSLPRGDVMLDLEDGVIDARISGAAERALASLRADHAQRQATASHSAAVAPRQAQPSS